MRCVLCIFLCEWLDKSKAPENKIEVFFYEMSLIKHKWKYEKIKELMKSFDRDSGLYMGIAKVKTHLFCVS